MLHANLLLDLAEQAQSRQQLEALLHGVILHLISAQRWLFRELAGYVNAPGAETLNHYIELSQVPQAQRLMEHVSELDWLDPLLALEPSVTAYRPSVTAARGVIASDSGAEVTPAPVVLQASLNDAQRYRQQLSDFITQVRELYAEF